MMSHWVTRQALRALIVQFQDQPSDVHAPSLLMIKSLIFDVLFVFVLFLWVKFVGSVRKDNFVSVVAKDKNIKIVLVRR
jgi:hypothetical protein